MRQIGGVAQDFLKELATRAIFLPPKNYPTKMNMAQ